VITNCDVVRDEDGNYIIVNKDKINSFTGACTVTADKLVISNPDTKMEYTGIDYKYNEGKILEEIRHYINRTYGEHYSQNKYQATEFIIDGGHGVGFTIGNILKYAQRYGHKGTPEEWRKDLMKVIHYAIMALYVHDLVDA
jgi:hypothetical protein